MSSKADIFKDMKGIRYFGKKCNHHIFMVKQMLTAFHSLISSHSLFALLEHVVAPQVAASEQGHQDAGKEEATSKLSPKAVSQQRHRGSLRTIFFLIHFYLLG